MAVSENDLIVGPVTLASGVSTISLDFYFEREEWLEVYKSGSEVALVLGVDYTVTGEGTVSGAVALTVPASGSDSYSVFLSVPLERSSDMQLRGEFKSGPFNLEMDRLWQRLQYHWTHIQRNLRLSATSTASGILSAIGAGQYIKMKQDGSGFEGVDAQILISAVDIWFNDRSDTAATQAAGLDDGTVFAMGGAVLVRDASVSLTESALADLGFAGFKFYDGSFVPLSGFGEVDVRVVRAAYLADAKVYAGQGDAVVLECDPTAGDDFQAMVYWAAGQRVGMGADLFVEVQDGLHDVNTIIQMTDNRNVLIKGTGVDHVDIASASFALESGTTYSVTVSTSTALPAQVVAGFAVGGQNVQGDGGADALNTAFIVETVAADRLSFTSTIQMNGVTPTAFTTPDNTASLGLAPNQLVVPKCTIRAAESGWDGAAQDEEGFITCLSGGRVDLKDIGLSYNGVAGDNDMIFARDAGSEVYLRDHVVIAGSGAMVSRSYGHGNIMAYGSFLGGGAFGTRAWQGSGGGTGNFTRTMMGSVSAEILSGSSGAYAWSGNCVLSGGNYGARTTYPNANIELVSSRVHQSNIGVGGSRGTMYIDSNSEISRCTTPITLSGGVVEGDPSIVSNTNAAPEHNIYGGQGGFWRKEFEPINGNLQLVGVYTGVVDFGSIANGDHEDLTITAADVADNDLILITKNNNIWPAQGVDYEAFPSSGGGTITIRAKNYSGGPLDPVTVTIRATALRSS